jgi:RHS repeat-associated protein
MAMKKRFYTMNGEMMAYDEGGVTKDLITDHLGSITAEINQSQVRTYDARYSAYGKSLWSTGTNSGFGWVGTYGYRETGLLKMSHYVRARHYSYVTGGWSTVDPLWPGECAYGYVGGSPTSFVDPQGAERVALELRAFVPKRLGLWLRDPFGCQMKGDNRTFGQEGSSRIALIVEVDSCGVGVATASFGKHVGTSSQKCTSVIWTKIATETAWITGSSFSPCFTSFHAVLEAAYPFGPPVAPTEGQLSGGFSVAGPGRVSAKFAVVHSVFPDFEVIARHNGKREVIYKYATAYPGWALLAHQKVTRHLNYTFSDVSVQSCCVCTPCCEGGCVKKCPS